MPLDALSPAGSSHSLAQPAGAGSRLRAQADRGAEVDPAAQRELARLQARDREVRQHEASHIGAGAGLTRGGASFTYERGPDGRLYAVGGEVSINTSPGRTPEETVDRARQIRAAALAPAEPSAQDRQVAAAAAAMEAEARSEIARGTADSDTREATQETEAGKLARAYASVVRPSPSGSTIDTFA